MKSILLLTYTLLLSTVIAGGETGFKTGGETGFKLGGETGFNTINKPSIGSDKLVHFFENLTTTNKAQKIIALPSNVKIEVDRDFISPINRWTLKTTNRDLLTSNIETIWKYDELKHNSLLYGETPKESELESAHLTADDF